MLLAAPDSIRRYVSTEILNKRQEIVHLDGSAIFESGISGGGAQRGQKKWPYHLREIDRGRASGKTDLAPNIEISGNI